MYESSDEILLDAEDKMEKSVEHLQQGLSGLRTGKASPALVDGISVECYGTQTRMNAISLISTPEPRLIVIKPFDPSSLPAIVDVRGNRFVRSARPQQNALTAQAVRVTSTAAKLNVKTAVRYLKLTEQKI